MATKIMILLIDMVLALCATILEITGHGSVWLWVGVFFLTLEICVGDNDNG